MIPLRGLVGAARHEQVPCTGQISSESPRTNDDNNSLIQSIHEERRAWSRSSTDSGFTDNHIFQDLTYHDNLSYDADIDRASLSNRSDLSITSRASTTSRTSHFREGSMNETSRALASTWFDHSNLSMPSVNNDQDHALRPSIDSHASTELAVDRKEFGPLKDSSSILKKTWKRLSRTSTVLSSVDTNSVGPVSAEEQGSIKVSSQETVRASRSGLRRSISSMKLFTGPTIDADESETDTNIAMTEALAIGNRSQRMRTVKSMKSFKRIKPARNVARTDATQAGNTLRLRTPRSRRTTATYDLNATVTQSSVLEERKRKAEVAYAEQFGTVKRVKNNTMTTAQPQTSSLGESDLDATIKRPGWSRAALRTVKSAFDKVGNNRHDVEATTPGTNNSMAQRMSTLLDPASLVDDDQLTPKLEKRLPPIPTVPARITYELADTSLSASVPHSVAQEYKTTRSHTRTSSRTSHASSASSTTANTELDRSKQRSYSQLEKENQQLRALLREKEAETVSTVRPRAGRRSLPAVEHAAVARTRQQTEHNWCVYDDSNADLNDLGATIVHVRNPNTGQDVAVLAPTNQTPTKSENMSQAKKTSTSRGASPIKRHPEVLRSLSIVLENTENENPDNVQGPQERHTNAKAENKQTSSTSPRPWIWDEDVF